MTTTTFSVEDRLTVQRDCVRQGKYMPLGRLVCVVLEAARDANTPPRDITKVYGVRMDWLSTGPLIGVSLDFHDLLIATPLPPLPKIPNPAWVPSGNGGAKTPYIEQRWEDFASGRLRGTNFLLFQPVAQILYRPANIPAFRIIKAETDLADGTKLALLVDPVNGQAHFYGGRFSI